MLFNFVLKISSGILYGVSEVDDCIYVNVLSSGEKRQKIVMRCTIPLEIVSSFVTPKTLSVSIQGYMTQ
jgi:hypothetical protein